MKVFYHDIAKQVDNGVYFEDAKEWYQQKYMYPVIERSFFLLLTTIAIFISIMAALVLVDFLPLVRHMPLIVKNDNTVETYVTIRNLAKESGQVDATKEDANNTLIKYLIEKFVESHETYDYTNNFALLGRNVTYIKQFSTQEVFNKYKYYVSMSNPNGLILKYREHTKRNIKVMRETFTIRQSKNPSLYTVDVKFTANELNVNRAEPTTWNARANIRLSEITYDRKEEKFNDIDFKVLNYVSIKSD